MPTTTSTSVRQRLLEAADELFTHKGVQAVGVDAIVVRAQVAKMSLYKHFASKEALVLAWLELRDQRFLTEFLAGIEERAASLAHSNPQEASLARLLLAFDALEDWARASHFRGCPFVLTAASGVSELARKRCEEHKRSVCAALERFARAGGLKHAASLAQALSLLLDGAAVAAQCAGAVQPIQAARAAAAILIDAARYGTKAPPPAELAVRRGSR